MIIDILALNWLTYANDSKNYTHMAPRPHKFLKYFWLKFETFGVFTVQHAFACYLPHSWGRQRKMCVHAHITIHFLHISLIRNTLGIVPHMCSSLLCWFPCFFSCNLIAPFIPLHVLHFENIVRCTASNLFKFHFIGFEWNSI